MKIYLTLSLMWIMIFTSLIYGMFLIPSISGEQPEVTINNLTAFLVNDTTDQHTYNPGPVNWYKCGHFSRDLAINASINGINLGTAILQSDFDIEYHVVNYAYVDGELLFVEPQSDKLYSSYDMGNQGLCSGMLLPYQTGAIVWVCSFEADVWFY